PVHGQTTFPGLHASTRSSAGPGVTTGRTRLYSGANPHRVVPTHLQEEAGMAPRSAARRVGAVVRPSAAGKATARMAPAAVGVTLLLAACPSTPPVQTPEAPDVQVSAGGTKVLRFAWTGGEGADSFELVRVDGAGPETVAA